MRAAVLVNGRQPGRAGVHSVRSGRRPRIELLNNRGPIHRRQPIRLTQIADLHKAFFHCPGNILTNGVSQTRRATTAKVIAHTRVTNHPSARTHRHECALAVGYAAPDRPIPSAPEMAPTLASSRANRRLHSRRPLAGWARSVIASAGDATRPGTGLI